VKKEVETLRKALAQANLAGATGNPMINATPAADQLNMMNTILAAVRLTAEGKNSDAANLLTTLQPRIPESDVANVLTALKDVPKSTVVNVTEPAPEATAKPTEEPTEKPTRKAKATARPTPKPTIKPKPTATEIPAPAVVADKDPGVAVPRPVEETRRLEPAEGKKDTSKGEDRARKLFEQKKRLTDQAVEALRAGNLDKASSLVEEAYRIDSHDPRVNQLRQAIREKQGK
jgi:outer membrane biosynthesis protein TonB